MQIWADFLILNDLVNNLGGQSVCSDGKVGCDGDWNLSQQEIADGLVIFGGFGSKEISDNDSEGEVVLFVKAGKLAKGRLEFAIDAANDKSVEEELSDQGS